MSLTIHPPAPSWMGLRTPVPSSCTSTGIGVPTFTAAPQSKERRNSFHSWNKPRCSVLL